MTFEYGTIGEESEDLAHALGMALGEDKETLYRRLDALTDEVNVLFRRQNPNSSVYNFLLSDQIIKRLSHKINGEDGFSGVKEFIFNAREVREALEAKPATMELILCVVKALQSLKTEFGIKGPIVAQVTDPNNQAGDGSGAGGSLGGIGL